MDTFANDPNEHGIKGMIFLLIRGLSVFGHFFLPLKTHRNIKPSVYMWGKSQTISDLNVSRSSRFCRHSLTKIRNYRFPRLFGMIGEK